MKKKLFQNLSVEDKLFVLQMAAKIINLEDPSNAEKIGAGNPLAEYAKKIAAGIVGDKHFDRGSLIALNSTTEVVAEFENVLVKVPVQPNSSPSRYILAYSPRLDNINALAVPSHLYFGYVMKRKDDGKVKPTVTLHFYGLPEEKLGKNIVANIAIKLQKDIRSGNKKMVIDVISNPGAIKNDWTMVIDTMPADHGNEFIVPETPEKCIRIKPVLRQRKKYLAINIAPIATETVKV